jgi:TonB family protein
VNGFEFEVLSFSPGFGPAQAQRKQRGTVSTVFSISLRKPLKRLRDLAPCHTRLKPGVNDRELLRQSWSKSMMSKNKHVVLLLLSVILTSASLTVDAQEKEEKYKPGQKWSYKARPGEEDSYLIVLKVDNDEKLGNIIHIALRKLKMKNERSPDGVSENLNHMPFSQEALDKSGPKLLEEKTDLPDFAKGYQMWRDAFDAGRGGIYSITVAEAVNAVEAGLSPRKTVTVIGGDSTTPVEGGKKSAAGAPITGGILNGRALKLPKPSYPNAARQSGASGVVVVRVLIDENGKVISAEAISGHPDLREVSEEAASRAEFTPTKLSGQPVKVTGVIQYNFVARRF